MSVDNQITVFQGNIVSSSLLVNMCQKCLCGPSDEDSTLPQNGVQIAADAASFP